MPDYTNNLNLTKVNTTVDGTNTFNVDTYLNSNWDTLDTLAGKTITTDKLVNNLASTEAGFGLDSRQGKVVGDRLNIVEGTLEDYATQLSENTQNIAQLSNPNLLINGDFQIWQRGNSFTIPSATNIYTVDRWETWVGNSSSVSISSINTGGLSINNSVAFTSDASFRQWIEIPQTAYGKTYTASINLNCTSSYGVSFFVVSFDGTTKTLVNSVLITTNSNSKTYTLTFTMPSTKYLMIGLAFSSTSVYYGLTSSTTCPVCTFNIFWSKLELGSIATPFVPRLYAEELALCQRYYEKIQSVNVGEGTFCIGFNQSTTQFQGILNYVKKRITPSITYDTPTNFRVHVTGGASTVSSFMSGNILPDRCSINANVSSNIIAGQGSCLERSDGCTPYITIDAEIY